MTRTTPAEMNVKGRLSVMSGAGRLPLATKPYVVALSRRGGEVGWPGLNKDWAADLIASECPDIRSRWRWMLLAEGIELRAGHVAALRRVRVTKPEGLPSYFLSPTGGWTTSGHLAKPAGALPA